VLSVPRVVFAAGGVGLSLVAVLGTRPADRAVPRWVLGGIFALILLPVVLAVQFAAKLPVGTVSYLVLGMAVTVIFWELVGGLLLMVPRFQGPLLAFSWGMHAVLSLIGFVHFGALAFAMLSTFVPARYFDLVTTSVRLPIVGRPVPRAHLYLAATS
jgi:hypothetical protein